MKVICYSANNSVGKRGCGEKLTKDPVTGKCINNIFSIFISLHIKVFYYTMSCKYWCEAILIPLHGQKH